MNKFHGIGLVVLLAVTFAMVESAYGSTVYTNDVGSPNDASNVNNTNISNVTADQSRFANAIFDNGKMNFLWLDDKVDDTIFFSTYDGTTATTPVIVHYVGGGGGDDQILSNSLDMFIEGNTIFVTWMQSRIIANEVDVFEKTSTDGGATFSVVWTVVINGTFTNNNLQIVGNALNDAVIFYTNSTTQDLEAFVSHNNGVTWAVESITGAGSAISGSPTIDDQSLAIDGNDIFVALQGNFTGGIRANFYTESTDAGDTWLTEPIRVSSATVRVAPEDGTNPHEPFLLQNTTDINIFYNRLLTPSNIEQARSTNGGTSFATEINTGLTGCSSVETTDHADIFALGSGDGIAIFCDTNPNINFVRSLDGGATFGSVTSISANSASTGFFFGFANNTQAIVVYEDNASTGTDGIFFSVDSFNTWSKTTDLFDSAGLQRGIGLTNDEVIIGEEDGQGGTDEVRVIDFEIPYCLTDPDFNCPFDVSSQIVVVSQPTNVAGVATTTGYHTIWQMNTSNDPHVYYASSPDAKSATTPLNISGIVLDVNLGVFQKDMHIFENGAGTIDAFWIEDHATNNEAFHARSINGGTSFGAKTAIATGILNIFAIEPVVDGNDLAVAYLNGTTFDTEPFFAQSANGGTTWNASINIEGGGDECNVAFDTIRLTKSASNNFYALWYGQNQTGLNDGICFNRSTNGGSVWGSTVLNLDDTPAEISDVQGTFPFELFSSGTDVTAIWTNELDDVVLQARSNDSGATFGAEEQVLNTVANPDCTDTATLAKVIQDGSSIYLICSLSSTQFQKSTNMGSTYSSLSQISPEFTSTWDAIANSGNIVVVGIDNNRNNEVIFSDDSGATWDTTTTIFQNDINHDVITGNSTNIYVGFAHKSSFDSANNNYVSMGTFVAGIPPDTTPPVITISGDNPVQHLINTTYNDGGAICIDAVDGSLTVTTDLSNVNTSVIGSFTVDYTCQDLSANQAQAVRTVLVVEQITTTTTTGGVGGAPVSGTVDTGIEGLTPAQILAFDQAVADAIASIQPSQGNIVETIIQTFFEFIVIDTVHEELQLQSFLDNERLGFRWSTGDDLVVVSATPALSPFMFTFEQFPVVRQGSGAFISTNFILYNLEVPRTECSATISVNCVEKIRYEIPVTVNAIINGTQVSDTGTITVDLTEDEIDPILLIILATLTIPIIGVIIQRSRGRSTIQPLRRIIS